MHFLTDRREKKKAKEEEIRAKEQETRAADQRRHEESQKLRQEIWAEEFQYDILDRRLDQVAHKHRDTKEDQMVVREMVEEVQKFVKENPSTGSAECGLQAWLDKSDDEKVIANLERAAYADLLYGDDGRDFRRFIKYIENGGENFVSLASKILGEDESTSKEGGQMRE